MLKQFVFAGFGGQGVLTAGMILANMGSLYGKEVIWMPSYGSEMRGGTANCSVKISDEAIASPFVKKIDYLIAMNKPSLDKFLPQMKEGGTVVVDSSIVTELPEDGHVKVVPVPADAICEELKNTRSVNVCILGALAGCSDLFSKEQYENGIRDYFSSKPQFHEGNIRVFEAGYAYVKEGAAFGTA